MADPLILALDAGTTSTRAMAFALDGRCVASAQRPIEQFYPEPGWVEQDAAAIAEATIAVAREVIGQVGAIAAIGITNQRETIVFWDAATLAPLGRAIVWQDRRTAALCRQMREAGHEPLVQRQTGLLLDPYFSGTKIRQRLDEDADLRAAAAQGRVRIGTIDSYLIARLTGGAHVTDATNASRTLLYDLARGQWSDDLLALMQTPRAALPEVVDSAGQIATTRADSLGCMLPITGIAGDQQAAAIGQACLTPGMVKSTYGTGCFVLANTGRTLLASSHRLLSTIAWQLGGERCYALEGSIFVAGSAIAWLRDGLGLIESSAESAALAQSVEDSGSVYVVPAFAGLGAPHWAPDARGTITGITGGTSRAHIVRATLEAMSYQTCDLMTAFRADGLSPARLRIDGGMARNDWLAQDLADMLDVPVDRPQITEATAWGAAMLAMVGAGLQPDLEAAAASWQAEAQFTPQLDAGQRAGRLAGWARAVRQTLAGLEP